MWITIEGIVRNGKIELLGYPDTIADETHVLITVLTPQQPADQVLAMTPEEAADLRHRLHCFTDDWLDPSMDGYDTYDATITHV